MLADPLTKAMVDCLWKEFYLTGCWAPKEALLCRKVGEGKRSVTRLSALLAMLDEEEDEARYGSCELPFLCGYLLPRSLAMV